MHYNEPNLRQKFGEFLISALLPKTRPSETITKLGTKPTDINRKGTTVHVSNHLIKPYMYLHVQAKEHGIVRGKGAREGGREGGGRENRA